MMHRIAQECCNGAVRTPEPPNAETLRTRDYSASKPFYHDDQKLRERVRAELLGPTKPPRTGMTPGQVAALRRLFRRGQSVGSLSRRFGIPEDAIRFALTPEPGQEGRAA